MYPEAARQKNEIGCLPLHLAAEDSESDLVLKALLAAFPEGSQACLSLTSRGPT